MSEKIVRDPIVLVHGLLGFDRLSVGGMEVRNYFPGIREYLQQLGNEVHVVRLSATRGVARRAEELKQILLSHFPHQSVHLIGHSMGGLDARYMISRLDMAKRVQTLTTIGTPHRGTPFADWGIRHLSRLLIPLFRWMGKPYEAFFDLTTERCQRFNEQVPNIDSVRYFSIAGRCQRPLIGAEWLLPWNIVREAEGENDGVVSVASAQWGETSEIWSEADHLNLVNWPNRYLKKQGRWTDRALDYGLHIQRLAKMGY